MYRQIALDDSNVFQFVTVKTGWTFEYYSSINTQNTSHIPVYTATLKPVAYVDIQTDAIIDATPERPIISFGANGDGSAGTNFVLHERPFYVSNDRTCLRILDKDINPQYVICKLSTMKRDYGFDFHYKALPKNLSSVSLSIPVNEKGLFDLRKQINIAAKLTSLSVLQDTIRIEVEQLKHTNIVLNIANYRMKEVSLSDNDLFSMFIGKRLLKKDMRTSGIPVYSASIETTFGYVSQSNIDDFSKPALLWGIDWIFNWKLIPSNIEFATTDHCGVLHIKHADLDSKYIYYALNATKNQYGFDRTYRASLKNIRDTVTVFVPVREDGLFDVATQANLARKYQQLEGLRRTAIEQLGSLLAYRITDNESEEI